MEDAKQRIILTGDRPTGKLHLGHLVGSLLNRGKLQDEGKPSSAEGYGRTPPKPLATERGTMQFVMIADVQALTDNADNPQKVRDNVLEVALDNLAVGVDPAKTTLFVQSGVPQIAELTIFFLNLVTLARLKRNPTVKDEMQQKGYGETVPVGFLAYPVSQAADILTFGATLVPVGEDQLPMIEQTNEIVRKFNSNYGEVFKEVAPLVGDAPRLPGIDGKAKMSKSLGNCIYLSDSNEEIREKVTQMYTDPSHVNKNDPGQVSGNVVFAYLDAFSSGGGSAFGGDDKKGLADLKARYGQGGVGDMEVKERLGEGLGDTNEPLCGRHAGLREADVIGILRDGTVAARDVADGTLRKVRHAMKIFKI